MRARAIAPGALAASLLVGHRAVAQDATPAASPVATPVAGAQNAIVNPLYSFELASFPEAPVSVRLLRMTLEPGASSPMHIHPGPEFDYVISGSLTVNSQGDATVVGGTGNEVTRELSADILTAGDLVVFPAGIGMNLINGGSDTLVIYSAVFHPITEEGQSTTYPDGDPTADAFAGLSYEVLGDGQIQAFPTGATTFTLDEIVIPEASDLPGIDGAALYSMMAGEFGFAVVSGSVQVSRTASPGLRPNAAPEQEFTLATADAAFFPAGVANATRADQPGELSILRLAAVPAEALSQEPAQISFLAPSAEPENDEGEVLTQIGIGATVLTTSGNLNLRAEPSTTANAITQLEAGVELTVIGGPEDADDYTWWQVRGVEDTSLEGWLASEFLELVTGAPSDGTQPTAATPEASPAASPEASPSASPAASPVAGEFSVGQIVATSQENVRVREDASINAEPVDAFVLGTEFEITGDPVEADDYTWYPVQLVADESVIGWVADDFIEVVDAG
jgi:quercetin dioxygenase-like cupin family protein